MMDQIKQLLAQGYTPQQLIAAGMPAEQVVAAMSGGATAQPAAAAPAQPATPVTGAALSSVAAALAGAKDGNSAGRKIPEGDHVVSIWNVSVRDTFYGRKFIVEFDAVESASAEIGGRYSAAPVIDPAKDQYGHGQNEARGFLNKACAEKFPSPLTWGPETVGQVLAWATGEDQPLRGKKLKLIAVDKVTRNNRTARNHFWEAHEDAAAGPTALAAQGLTPQLAALGQQPAAAMPPGVAALLGQQPAAAPAMNLLASLGAPQGAPAQAPATGLPAQPPPGWIGAWPPQAVRS